MTPERKVLLGDCIEQMQALEDDSIDSIVCDPPYGIGFMGKVWDGKAIADAANRDRERRKDLGGHSASRPGRKEPRSSSAFGNEAIIAGPVKGGSAFQVWCAEWAAEALRVLKPGGHMLAFGGTRTYHRLVAGVEDAGFEIRDMITWHYGEGFPKSHNVSKAIDAAAGAEREVVGSVKKLESYGPNEVYGDGPDHGGKMQITAPATPEAEQWEGWGTALKPSCEPVVLARKPLQGTVAANVLEHGTGAINIDGCRVRMSVEDADRIDNMGGFGTVEGAVENEVYGKYDGSDSAAHAAGRWPANVVLTHHPDCTPTGATRKVPTGTAVRRNMTPGERGARPGSSYDLPRTGGPDTSYGSDGYEDLPVYDCHADCPVAMMDGQSGESTSAGGRIGKKEQGAVAVGAAGSYAAGDPGFGDTGGASRFFYVTKATTAEREAGLRDFDLKENPSADYGTKAEHPLTGKPNKVLPRRNNHPTVKPIDLMRYLIRLITPPDGTVLDPFCGSGTTGCAAALEGVGFVGIEREAEYREIALARISWWERLPEGTDVLKALATDRREQAIADTGQTSLLDL